MLTISWWYAGPILAFAIFGVVYCTAVLVISVGDSLAMSKYERRSKLRAQIWREFENQQLRKEEDIRQDAFRDAMKKLRETECR